VSALQHKWSLLLAFAWAWVILAMAAYLWQFVPLLRPILALFGGP
jgi:hypothetical protein